MTGEAHGRAIELLRATHTFPVDYALSVVALNVETVSQAVRSAAEQGLPAPLAAAAYTTRASAQGKYLSHRICVPCQEPADVLALYQRMRAIEGVVTVI